MYLEQNAVNVGWLFEPAGLVEDAVGEEGGVAYAGDDGAGVGEGDAEDVVAVAGGYRGGEEEHDEGQEGDGGVHRQGVLGLEGLDEGPGRLGRR